MATSPSWGKTLSIRRGTYARLIRASQTWRRIVISDFELMQGEGLPDELEQDYRERKTSAVKPAAGRRFDPTNSGWIAM